MPDDLEDWKNLTEADKVQIATGGFKKVSNARQRKFSKLGLSVSSMEGNDLLMRTIKKDRQKAISKMRRKFD